MKGLIVSHFISIIILPFNAIVTIPYIILFFLKEYKVLYIYQPQSFLIGLFLIFLGIVILAATIKSFDSVGKGTLSPLNPPKKIVTTGLYKYIRHPMISGVILTILGESIIFQSQYLLIFVLIFLIVNVIYLRFIEEPSLIKRFGIQYIEYQQNVPSFIPRFKPRNKK
jgi:protein-S-isoprenylcysteine O-methyltransferase Ste14